MELNECYKRGFIKKTKPSTNLIKSLIEMSDMKELTVNEAKLNEVNISVYVSMAYDSLREVLEALCISKGYKVTSHICIGKLLKTLVIGFNFVDFDRLRYIRNSINYYGTKIDYDQGRELIKKIFKIKKDITNNFK